MNIPTPSSPEEQRSDDQGRSIETMDKTNSQHQRWALLLSAVVIGSRLRLLPNLLAMIVAVMLVLAVGAFAAGAAAGAAGPWWQVISGRGRRISRRVVKGTFRCGGAESWGCLL